MMRSIVRSLRARGGATWRDERGAAAVEMALVTPILVMLLFGIVEFARVWNVKQVLTDAAREGTRVAVVAERQNLTVMELRDSVERVIRRTAVSAGIDTSPAKLTIDTTEGIGGAGGTQARVQLTYQYTPLFGTWVLSESALRLRSTSVMRNE